MRSPAFTLDAGALIALERHDRRVTALLDGVRQRGQGVLIPAGVVAQAYRAGARSAPVARLLATSDAEVIALDEPTARAAGVLLGARRRRDVIDASVVICARQFGTPVVTSDPHDLQHLDPTLRIVAL